MSCGPPWTGTGGPDGPPWPTTAPDYSQPPPWGPPHAPPSFPPPLTPDWQYTQAQPHAQGYGPPLGGPAGPAPPGPPPDPVPYHALVPPPSQCHPPQGHPPGPPPFPGPSGAVSSMPAIPSFPPPPATPYGGGPGYDWSGPPLTQHGPPGPPQPPLPAGPEHHKMSWPGTGWEKDQGPPLRPGPEDHQVRCGGERTGTSGGGGYLEGRSREREPPRGQDRPIHPASRASYEKERCKYNSRYKDDYYSSKYSDEGWGERGSSSSSRRRHSRSPSDFTRRGESRPLSPSSRSSRDPHDRYERERGSVAKPRYREDWAGEEGRREREKRPRKRSRSPPERRKESRSSYLSPSHTAREKQERPGRSDERSGRSPGRLPRPAPYTRSPDKCSNSPTRTARLHSHPRSPDKGMRRSSRSRSRSPRLPDRKRLERDVSASVERSVSAELDDPTDEAKKDEVTSVEEVKAAWIRSAPADLHYQRSTENPLVMQATKRLMQLCNTFEEKLIKRGQTIREEKTKQKENKEAQSQQQSSTCRSNCSNAQKEENKDDKLESSAETAKETGETVGTKEKDTSKEEEKNDETIKTNTSDKDGGNADPEEKTEEENGSSNTETDNPLRKCAHKHKKKCKGEEGLLKKGSGSSSSSDSSSSSEDEEESEMDRISKELEKKRNHPDRLHPELWFNDTGEMNDGPLCRCSLKAQRSGIRHGYYVGEDNLSACDPWTNNATRLHHYLITISPPTNFLIKTPTVIMHDNHEFIFEGFSLLSHHRLEEVPTCRVIRFNIEYTILYIEEKIPDNFCVQELNLFYNYLFLELLELVDLNLHAVGDTAGCPRFHFMPRFVRKLPDNGKEILSMNEVLSYMLRNSGPLVQPEDLATLLSMTQYQWQNFADQVKGMVVTSPGMKPSSIRVDQLDRDQVSEETINYPVIVHFGIRPPQLSYAGNPEYQKAWREYVKFRHLLANMPKPSFDDKRRLEAKENRLQEMRMTSKMKRDVTVAVSSQGFYRTGIMCDVVQHSMLLPVLVCHLRFHQSLMVLEEQVRYTFQNRYLLQLALTHPSYRENFGTNPDHARNSLTNCGIRQPEYGDRRIHYMNTRKRGINTLINIMSKFGRHLETESKITHNERLEFLGDAVVEFLTSIHLFHLFPSLEEGGLATYRAAIVQNQHLAVLAEKLGLDQFMLYAHGSDLCHDFELRHAMANCFEALMGAIFLDSGIEEADKVLSSTLFKAEETLHSIWVNYPPHPIQEQEPNGDRKWIKSFPILTKLAKFEESIGVQFNHIRLLARAFTDRSIGFNNLTLGSNQRLEFLGDTVLQLVSSEYLYRYFPEHHEGHLSLLRSSLVNNRTQAVVCDDLGMTSYAMYSHLKTELKTKDRADLLEAFLGALYIDRGLKYCRTFCHVCFFPRLHQFIMNQDWNDPKSKLQQCCLTLRTMDGGEPDIPIYKVIECKGPTNTRVYTVAVYFRAKRLAKASGHSIQQAEMNAAREALMNSKELFPQLDHQRRVIEKSVKIQGVSKSDRNSEGRERDRDRGGRTQRKDEDRRSDRDKYRDREKSPETRRREGSKTGDRKTRDKEFCNTDNDKLYERSKAGDREKNGDRMREYRDRGDVRRVRGEAEEPQYRQDRGMRTAAEGRARHLPQGRTVGDRHRDRYKPHGRSRQSENDLMDSSMRVDNNGRGNN